MSKMQKNYYAYAELSFLTGEANTSITWWSYMVNSSPAGWKDPRWRMWVTWSSAHHM